MSKYLSSLIANIFEKMLIKVKYLTKIVILLINEKVILYFQSKYFKIKLKFKEIIFIINVLIFLLVIILVDFFSTMIFLKRAVKKALANI